MLKLKNIQVFFIICITVILSNCAQLNSLEKKELEIQIEKKDSKISSLEEHVKNQNEKLQEFEKIIQQMNSKLNNQVPVERDINTNIKMITQEDSEKSIITTSDKRGIGVVTIDKDTGTKEEVPLYKKTYAVIIGIDQYKNLQYDMQLSYAVKDAKGVEDIIRKKYRFDKVHTLYNEEATKSNIINLLSGQLSNISKEDSVFIFWSGHGHSEKTALGDYLGFLIPYDGTFDESELHKNISMTLIKEDISKRIPAKHIFYVMDSCYSGLLAAKKGVSKKSKRNIDYLKEITKETSRQVLTAGSVNQQVLDGGPMGHSVFAGRLIELLENAEDYITAHEISTYIKEKVFSDAKARNHKQTPTYGELFGLGDYVFVPSMAKRVENIDVTIKKYQEEIQKLNELEIAAQKANDERKKRKAELQKREIQAKLKAEQLKQERIFAEKERIKRQEAERVKKEQELIQAEKQRALKLALLKKQVEDKRNSLGNFTYSSLSPAATVKEMQEIDAKILSIKEKYRKVLAESINIISKQVNATFEQANREVKSEFESENDFRTRVQQLRDKASKKQTNGFIELKKKIENEYNKEVEPFINELKKLSAQEFHISSQDLNLEIGKYNGEFDVYPVKIESLQKYNGVMVACSANIPIPRQEAKIFKQHFQNNILRSEIKGNFQSIEFFRIAEAYIIDDATNKKYDLFSSKFVEIGNDIVYDSVTNLLWLRNANYFRREFYFKDALKACENLNIQGLSGFRLPTVNELSRMRTVYKKQEMHPFFNLQDYYGVVNSNNRYCYCYISQNRSDCSNNDRPIWPVRGR